jgi:hypothetical protein
MISCLLFRYITEGWQLLNCVPCRDTRCNEDIVRALKVAVTIVRSFNGSREKLVGKAFDRGDGRGFQAIIEDLLEG